MFALPGFCWPILNKRPPGPAAKSKVNKEIPIQAPTAVPGFESEEEDTKIIKSKLDDKPDQLNVLKNMKLVNEIRTMSWAAALTTVNSQGAEVGEVTGGGHQDSG